MKIEEMSKEQLLDLMYHLRMTEGLNCPEEIYRPKGTSLCFDCNECWQKSIENKLKGE